MNEQPYESYRDPSEIRHTIGPTGLLSINNVSGRVDVRAVDGGEVTVIARSHSGRSEWLPITVRKSDGALTIEVEKRGSFAMFGSWFGSHDGLEFEVSVPRSATVIVNTVSAEIRARDLAGEQSFKTVSGDAEIETDGGRLRVTTVSGDVQVTNRKSADVNVNTTSGDLRVAGAEVARLDVRTVSGDIKVEAGLAAGAAHTVETVSGDLAIDSPTGVTVDVRKSIDMRHGGSRGVVIGDGAAQLRFRTLSGDVRAREAREFDGGRRHGRDRDRDDKYDRFERQLERRIERQMRKHGGAYMSNDIDFPDFPQPPAPPTPPAAPTAPVYPPVDQLEVLRALERGEIDVDEASRRLQEA